MKITRRGFGRTWAALTAGAAAGFEPAMAQLSIVRDAPTGAVRINANENPLGPCAEAAEAMCTAVRSGGRYSFEEGFAFARLLGDVEGVPAECVRPFAGSSDPLYRAVAAFASPSRGVVAADPGYEAPLWTAAAIGAKAWKVPLTKSYAHDVRAMAKADASAGLFYLCNPNNPTGTLTPRADIEWLVANKPAGSIVLIDEAYIHLSESAAPCVDMARAGRDVIVLRTFSKLYGMAGLRAGAAIGRPDLLDKLMPLGANMLPVTGMVGAQASLRAKGLVTERRKLIAAVRDDTFDFLTRHKIPFVRSESNKFMLDAGRPGEQVVRAMARENVYIGRVWPAWPNHVRVSVGTREEMAKFQAALVKVLG